MMNRQPDNNPINAIRRWDAEQWLDALKRSSEPVTARLLVQALERDCDLLTHHMGTYLRARRTIERDEKMRRVGRVLAHAMLDCLVRCQAVSHSLCRVVVKTAARVRAAIEEARSRRRRVEHWMTLDAPPTTVARRCRRPAAATLPAYKRRPYRDSQVVS